MIWASWNDKEKWIKKKASYERNIYFLEVLFEAVPSALIYTFLWYSSSRNKRVRDLVQGSSTFWFYLSFIITIISSSLGLAKCLLSSSVSVLSQGGHLGGLISGHFFMAWLACLFTVNNDDSNIKDSSKEFKCFHSLEQRLSWLEEVLEWTSLKMQKFSAPISHSTLLHTLVFSWCLDSLPHLISAREDQRSWRHLPSK